MTAVWGEEMTDINYWRQLFKNGSSRGVTPLPVLVAQSRTETGREDEGSGADICRGSAGPRPVELLELEAEVQVVRRGGWILEAVVTSQFLFSVPCRKGI